LDESHEQIQFWERCYDEVEGTLVPPHVTLGMMLACRVLAVWKKELKRLQPIARLLKEMIDACEDALADN
jgi:hypothetical protein